MSQIFMCVCLLASTPLSGISPACYHLSFLLRTAIIVGKISAMLLQSNDNFNFALA